VDTRIARLASVIVASILAVGLIPAIGVELSERDRAGGPLLLLRGDDAGRIAHSISVVHDYGDLVLVRAVGGRPEEIGRRSHALPVGDAVGFGSWSGSVPMCPDPERLPPGVYVVRLVGPMDPGWRAELAAAGVEPLAAAHPHGMVVRGDGEAFRRATTVVTSEGLPVVCGIARLPIEARLHRSLIGLLDGGTRFEPIEVELRDYSGRIPAGVAKRTVRVDGSGLRRLLLDDPEIGYVEPVLDKELHNNLAGRWELLGVEEAWGAGFVGDGVTVLHNDSGADLEHSGLAASVIASVGKMEYTDTAHGTHTAGSIVGIVDDPAPFNTSGCGDVIPGLPTAGGMAPGAKLVTNNIFVGGYGAVPEMMAWGAGHGAQLGNNSWGLLGLAGPEVGYSSAAAEVDAAVRDADPATAGAQPMTIFFSAGNTGPDPGTVTSPGTAKNAITVGAVQNARCGAWVPSRQPGPDPATVVESSGRGPSQQRFKPDLVAPGSDVLSLESRDGYAAQPWDRSWTGPVYALNTGTSQACALATGAGALVHELLWRTTGRRPSPALLKAMLIATADRSGAAVDADRGWGRITLSPMMTTALPAVTFDEPETAELTTGELWSNRVAVRSADRALELVLVWSDAPGEADADHPLVNDLDLVVTTPSGVVLRGNVFEGGWSRPDPGGQRDLDNNVEVVRVPSPEVGDWTVEVVAVDVASPPAGLDGQDFAIAAAGDVGFCLDPPPPPAGVVADSAGPNAIRVSWSPVANATRYEVARAADQHGHPFEVVATVPGEVTSITDEGLSGGTTYFYVVRAERECWSDDSFAAAATASGPCTLAPIFAGVAAVDVVASTGCSLELTWDPATPTCSSPVEYAVYRGGVPGFVPSEDNRIAEGISAGEWIDRVLEPDREYFYVVRASHADGDADDGNTVRLGARTTGPDHHYLYLDGAGDDQALVTAPGSEADSGTRPWFVTASDAWVGERSWFIDDDARVKDQVLRLRDPIPLADGEPPLLEFYHRMRLDRGRDGGRLEYSTNGGRDWHDILAGDGQTVPEDPERFLAGGYTDTIAAPANPLFLEEAWSGDTEGWLHSVVDLSDFAGRRLLLRWRFACDDTFFGNWGWWVDAIRLFVERECRACVPPEPPPWLSATATGVGVELSWPEVPGAVAYRLFRSTDLRVPEELIASVAAPETTHLDPDVSGGTTYYYVVRTDDGCLSDPSGLTTETAAGPCTAAPLFWGLDEVIDRRGAECALDLEWRPAEPGCAGADVGYRVYRSPQPDFDPGPDTLIAADVAGPRFRDTTIADGDSVHYRVRAVDGISGAEEANPVIHRGSTTGPVEVLYRDSVEDGTAGWWTALGSTADSGTEPWAVAEDVAHDGSRSWFCANEERVKDQVVGLTRFFEITDETTVLAFFHLFDLEPFWDGGRLEYSTDGGASWHDILSGDGATVPAADDRFVRGGYTGFVSVGTGHPFGGSPAWTGFDDRWWETVVALRDFVGLSVGFRWRLGCDRSDARVGWWLDEVELRTTTRCETVELPPPRETGDRRP
jgi:hypothetical protein